MRDFAAETRRFASATSFAKRIVTPADFLLSADNFLVRLQRSGNGEIKQHDR